MPTTTLTATGDLATLPLRLQPSVGQLANAFVLVSAPAGVDEITVSPITADLLPAILEALAAFMNHQEAAVAGWEPGPAKDGFLAELDRERQVLGLS